jgi:hypothetical protein
VNLERVTWIGVLVPLLIAGLLIGRLLFAPPEDVAASSFREWFWEHRALDLLVQVGFIFAGALGIAALLPRGKEEA